MKVYKLIALRKKYFYFLCQPMILLLNHAMLQYHVIILSLILLFKTHLISEDYYKMLWFPLTLQFLMFRKLLYLAVWRLLLVVLTMTRILNLVPCNSFLNNNLHISLLISQLILLLFIVVLQVFIISMLLNIYQLHNYNMLLQLIHL